jgi:microcystin degradation protein MlrC
VPIVATLDLHTNITREMVRAADVLVTYHSMPHIDIFETGQRGAEVLRRLLFEGAKPATAFCKIPAVVPAENSSTEAAAGVAVDLKRRVVELEAQPNVLSAGIAPVQPWMDIPQFGSSVVVTTDNDPAAACAACVSVAEEFWRRRREYMPTLVSVEDAVWLAHDETDLTVLSDAADATTSGAPGDSVWILSELLKYRWPREALVTVVAPEVVEQCGSVALGTQRTISLGGLRDNRFGTRIELAVIVERCFDARFTMTGHIGKNMPIDMGRSAVLRHESNTRVIVTTRSGPHFAPELFRAAGFEPFEASVVIAKSPCGFRAVYAEHAAAIYSVKAPGCAPSDFWNYDFKNIPRPLWPWDDIEHWTPTQGLMEK